MSVKKFVLLIAFCIAFTAFLPGCNNSGETAEGSASTYAYNVEVKTEGGMPIAEAEIRIYEQGKTDDLVWAGETDKDGNAVFSADSSKTYIAVLKNVPAGYQVDSSYPVTANTTAITLKTVLLDAGDLMGYTYELGSVVRDFSVTGVNGNAYKISELLKIKKAVVLNFWFINCGPCKMEFPYLQAAYEEYKGDVEVLALNPVDGTDASVSDYATEQGLTFPMAACDANWQSCMRLNAYPTTVVIDRYGTIAMIHRGSITQTGVFEKIFAYFTADDYKQTTIRNISDIE